MKDPTILSAAVVLLAWGAASANPVIVSESFGGLATANLNGTTADTFAPAIVTAGGSATWAASEFFKANGSVAATAGRSAHLNLGSYINDAKGTPDGLFELSVTISPVTGTWLSIGFSSSGTPSVGATFTAASGLGTMAYRANGDIDMWAGLNNQNEVAPDDVLFTGSRTLTITLDLREWNGTTNFGTVSFRDSVVGPFGSHNFTVNRNFGSILLSSATSSGTYSNLTLTQFVVADDPPVLTITPALAPATGYDLEWSSKAGKAYNLRSSTDLDGPISTWDILEGDIAATPPANLVNVQADGPRRFYAVEEFDAPPLLEEDFEEVVGPAPPAGWTRTDNGAGTVWEVGTPAGGGDYVPNAAAVGTQCVGTNINAQYTANADASLVSPAFTVPESGATLSYWQYIDTETSPSNDLGSIRVLNAADDSFLADVVTNIEGVSTTWSPQSVDLPAAANGLEVKLEFRFVSNAEGNWGGFYIDDVMVTAK